MRAARAEYILTEAERDRTSEHWFWEYENNPIGHLIGVA